MEHLEDFIGKTPQEIADDEMSCVVIGIRGARVKFSSMKKMETEETDWKHRRPKNEYWTGLKGIVDMLSGRPKGNGAPEFPNKMPV
jgi:6-phosphofructokinase 1